MVLGRRFGIAFAVLLIVSLTTNMLVGVARQDYAFPGPLAATTDVVVPRGTAQDVAVALHDAGVIRSVWQFRIAAFVTGGRGVIHAGEFAFPRGASLQEVLDILRTGKPVEHALTIPEGLTAAQIAHLLEQAPAVTGETPVPREGAALPETYSYVRGTTRAVLLGRATAAMDVALARVWAGRAADLPLGSARELLTLASIIERETARPEERAHVAAVYLNRLRIGMKLQADPTVVYAVSGGSGVLARALTRGDLAISSPYNTYETVGLPPGPIASPGVGSLEAAAHPMPSDDLYFVADGAGGHAFARTYEAHQQNVARWRALGH